MRILISAMMVMILLSMSVSKLSHAAGARGRLLNTPEVEVNAVEMSGSFYTPRGMRSDRGATWFLSESGEKFRLDLAKHDLEDFFGEGKSAKISGHLRLDTDFVLSLQKVFVVSSVEELESSVKASCSKDDRAIDGTLETVTLMDRGDGFELIWSQKSAGQGGFGAEATRKIVIEDLDCDVSSLAIFCEASSGTGWIKFDIPNRQLSSALVLERNRDIRNVDSTGRFGASTQVQIINLPSRRQFAECTYL